MKTILTARGFNVPDANFKSIQDWCNRENISNSKSQRDIEDELNKVGVVKRWTPAVSFDTPGDLAVSYTTQVADVERTKEVITATFRIVTSGFTYTTASGKLRITGLPYTASTSSNDSACVWHGAVLAGGWTKANYTYTVAQIVAGTNYILIGAGGSGQAPVNLGTVEFVSGSSVVLSGNVSFRLKP